MVMRKRRAGRRRIREKLTNAQVKDIVEEEGIAYAIQKYMSSDDIADPLLKEAWEHAKEALEGIEAILKHAGEDICAACGRSAPLVDGECPDCRH